MIEDNKNNYTRFLLIGTKSCEIKENISYKKLNFYENLEKAKDSFKDENYEKSKEMALQSAEDSLSTLAEINIVKSNRNEFEKLFDNALIEKLQFDKKENDDIKNSIKDIEKSTTD